MRVKGIVWVGTRTDRFAEMHDFLRWLTAADPWLDLPGFAAWNLPNGDRVELFGDGDEPPRPDAPLAGFLVDDVEDACRELADRGLELVGPVHAADDGNRWAHFRAPDGHLYELTDRPDHPAHRDG